MPWNVHGVSLVSEGGVLSCEVVHEVVPLSVLCGVVQVDEGDPT